MDSNSSTVPASAEAPKRPPHRGPFGITHNLALASIGIAGVLGDEAQALYRRSIERGGNTVHRVRERLPRARRPQRRSAKPGDKRRARSHQVSDTSEAVLARLNLPSEADIDALTRQIAELEAQIDQLTP
jgi:hypothetical protein